MWFPRRCTVERPSAFWSPLLDGRHEAPPRRRARPGRLVFDGSGAAYLLFSASFSYQPF